MKDFIQKLLFFFLGLILINIFFYTTFFKTILWNPYSRNKNELEKYRSFLFSDSHGGALERTNLFKIGVFNFSNGSDSYVDIYYKLNFLFENHIHIDTIFLAVDEYFLNKRKEIYNNENRSIIFSTFSSFRNFNSNKITYYDKE